MDAGADCAFNRTEWAASYQNTKSHPEGFWLKATEGEIPAELLGTYFRNGPGLFVHGEDRVAHPFDGHGLVASISFTNGRAFFRSQYVQTKAYQDETSEDRILYKGTFGTMVPGGVFKNLFRAFPRNPANTGILPLGGDRCLALFEAGQPYAMDPETLVTKGVDTLGGNISAGAPFSTGWTLLDRFAGALLALLGFLGDSVGGDGVGGDAVCAHPMSDPVSGNTMLFTFRLQLGLVAYTLWLFRRCFTLQLPGLVTRLAVREFDEDLVQQSVVHTTMPGYCFLHDMSLTETKYIAFCNPVRLHMLPLLLGLRCPIHCIRWSEGPTRIVLLDRPVSAVISPSAAHQVSLADSPASAGGPGAPPLEMQREGCGGRKGQGSRLRSRRGTMDSAQDSGMLEESSKGLGPEDDGPSTAATSHDLRSRDPQDAKKAISVLHAEPAFVFHQANAFEEGSTITVDAIRYPTMPDFEQASGSGNFLDSVDPQLQPISQLWRYSMDLDRGHVTERMLSARAIEFPAINPHFTGRRHRYVFAAAATHETLNLPQQAICKLDTQTSALLLWEQDSHYYTGEPIFVPSPQGIAEDDGWILSVCYDASTHSSECVILDARGLQLVARLPLCHALPHGLHGSWHHISHIPAAGAPDEAAGV